MLAEMLGHGNDIEAGDDRCLASPLLFELGGLEHCDEFVPHFVGMLAAKLALAIAPAARGDDAREALFYSTRVAADRRPKTVADHAHPQWIAPRLLGQPVQRVLSIADLIVAQDIPLLNFPLAAPATVDTD